MWKSIIAAEIKTALQKYAEANSKEIEEKPIKIEYPVEDKYGDYSTPVAMENAKVFRMAPIKIAEGIIEHLDKAMFEKVEVAPPGFINMTLSGETLNKGIADILAAEKYGANIVDEPKKMLVEYVSANPTGPLHIGHGRWAAIGDALTKVLNYAGHTAEREFYINDAGEQIAKLNASVEAVKNGKDVPEDGYHGSYIKDLAKLEGEPKDIILKWQKDLLKNFGVVFDRWSSEKAFRDTGEVEKTIEWLKESGYAYEQDGAVWFKSTDFADDKDRVLVKTNGQLTYFAVDITYHKKKIERNYDILINVLGADHHGYVPRLSAAVDVLSEKKTKLLVIIGQLVSLFRDGEPVRMSKRTGDMISLEDVIEEIGVSSARYFLTMRSANTALDFDLELAKKTDNENPVYYIQYAYARICNIFLQLKEKNLSFDENAPFDIAKTDTPETKKLVLLLMRLPDEINEVQNSLEIHRLTAYLHDLAAALHKFYYGNIVLDEDESVRNARLVLMKAVKKVLTIGFDLIGVEKKEKM